MTRDKATRILERICTAADSGQLPVEIREVWVFGSYARGALEPGDLDLIVVHGEADPELTARWNAEARRKARNYVHELYYARLKLSSLVRASLRRPGEHVDILTGDSVDSIANENNVLRTSDRVLLWSTSDRAWQAKLSAIKPDSSAGSFEHGLYLKPKIAGCSLSDIQELSTCLEHRVLTAEMIDVNELELWADESKWPKGAQRVLRYSDGEDRTMGRKRRACVPYAIAWLLRQGASDIIEEDWDFLSSDRRHIVSIGPMRPGWYSHTLCGETTLESIAHLLHFKKSQPRVLHVFRRGERWMDEPKIRWGRFEP